MNKWRFYLKYWLKFLLLLFLWIVIILSVSIYLSVWSKWNIWKLMQLDNLDILIFNCTILVKLTGILKRREYYLGWEWTNVIQRVSWLWSHSLTIQVDRCLTNNMVRALLNYDYYWVIRTQSVANVSYHIIISLSL